MKHKQQIKAYIEKQNRANKPVSTQASILTHQTPAGTVSICQKKLTAFKEVTFPYTDMHRNLTVFLNTPISNRYEIEFKARDNIGQILTFLGIDNYEGISYKEC